MNDTFIFAGMVIACICIVANAIKEFSEKVNWCIKRERDNLMQGNALLHAHIQAQDSYIKSLEKQLDELKRSIQSKKDSLEEKIRIIESGRLPPLACCRSESDFVRTPIFTDDDKGDLQRLKDWQAGARYILMRISDDPSGVAFEFHQTAIYEGSSIKIDSDIEIHLKFRNGDFFVITDDHIEKYRDLL